MFWRPPVKYRVWWDTDFARLWNVTETIGRLWARHLVPFPPFDAANDPERLRW